MKAYEKKIPRFKSEDKERDFWATADSTEYIDWEKSQENCSSEPQAFPQQNLLALT